MKGISALIASVLLVAFVVSVGLLVMGWFTTLTRSTTVSVTNKTSEGIECSSAAIGIVDVYITGTMQGTTRAIIKNTGYTDNLIIVGADFYNTTGHNFTASSLPIGDFDKGELQTLSFPSTNVSSCPANFSRVVVSTNCGGISDTFSGTPKCS